jgi:hypothetical protein
VLKLIKWEYDLIGLGNMYLCSSILNPAADGFLVSFDPKVKPAVVLISVIKNTLLLYFILLFCYLCKFAFLFYLFFLLLFFYFHLFYSKIINVTGK